MQTIHASFNTFTLLCYPCIFPRRLMVMSCHRPASDPNRIFKTDVNPNSRHVINEIVNINGNLFLRMPFNCTRTHFSQSSIKGIANSREMKVLRESRNLTYSMSMAQDLCPFIFSPLAFITGRHNTVCRAQVLHVGRPWRKLPIGISGDLVRTFTVYVQIVFMPSTRQRPFTTLRSCANGFGIANELTFDSNNLIAIYKLYGAVL